MQGAVWFEPNAATDPRFAEALRQAHTLGVKVMAYDSVVTEDEIRIGHPVPVKL